MRLAARTTGKWYHGTLQFDINQKRFAQRSTSCGDIGALKGLRVREGPSSSRIPANPRDGGAEGG
jgi:hypothetical protein